MLNIETEKKDGELLVSLEGRLNNIGANDLSRRIDSELEGVKSIVFDFAKLDYVSSAGLRVLLAAQQHMEANGGEDVCVRNANALILDTLEMTGFRGVINVQ